MVIVVSIGLLLQGRGRGVGGGIGHAWVYKGCKSYKVNKRNNYYFYIEIFIRYINYSISGLHVGAYYS